MEHAANKVIVQARAISEATVTTHLTASLTRCGVATRTQVVVEMARHGWRLPYRRHLDGCIGLTRGGPAGGMARPTATNSSGRPVMASTRTDGQRLLSCSVTPLRPTTPTVLHRPSHERIGRHAQLRALQPR